jgi:hypothetical protein
LSDSSLSSLTTLSETPGLSSLIGVSATRVRRNSWGTVGVTLVHAPGNELVKTPDDTTSKKFVVYHVAGRNTRGTEEEWPGIKKRVPGGLLGHTFFNDNPISRDHPQGTTAGNFKVLPNKRRITTATEEQWPRSIVQNVTRATNDSVEPSSGYGPPRNSSSLVLNSSRWPFMREKNIRAVSCKSIYESDYMEASDVSLHPLLDENDSIATHNRKRKAIEAMERNDKRQRRVEDWETIHDENEEHLYNQFNADVEPDPWLRDRQLARIYELTYKMKEANWQIIHSWRKTRELNRLFIMSKLNLRDQYLGNEVPDGHLIGKGGQARVYIKPPSISDFSLESSDSSYNGIIAVKMGFKLEIQKEIRWLQFLKTFRHPNIVEILEHINIHNNIWCIIDTPLSNCGSLAVFVTKFHAFQPGECFKPNQKLMPGWRADSPAVTLPEELVWVMTKQILQAVNFLHTGELLDGHSALTHWIPIIHCDIKPGNILIHYNDNAREKPLDDQYNFKVSDFGHAHWDLDAGHVRYPATAMYMAPEWNKRSKSDQTVRYGVGVRHDIWCVGASIHHAVAFCSPRWTEEYIIARKVWIDGHLNYRNTFDRMKYQPINVLPIHLRPDHPQRFRNEKRSPSGLKSFDNTRSYLVSISTIF